MQNLRVYSISSLPPVEFGPENELRTLVAAKRRARFARCLFVSFLFLLFVFAFDLNNLLSNKRDKMALRFEGVWEGLPADEEEYRKPGRLARFSYVADGAVVCKIDFGDIGSKTQQDVADFAERKSRSLLFKASDGAVGLLHENNEVLFFIENFDDTFATVEMRLPFPCCQQALDEFVAFMQT